MLTQNRNNRDIVGGALLVLIGTFALVYALVNLRLGTMASMGPGMFPAALGVIMIVLGIAIMVPALVRPGRKMSVDLRATLAVVAGMLLFGFLVGPLGLAPAILALTLVASRADSRLSIAGAAILGLVLATASALLFRVGLNLQLPIVAGVW